MAFGAKIKLSVDNSGASTFRKEIQKYVNNATSSKPIKLKNFSVRITKEDQKRLINDLQTYLSGSDTLKLKIGEIDATAAVEKLRKQLTTMLSGLSITGLKEFLGESNIDEATKKIDDAKKKTNELAGKMSVLKSISQKTESTYKTALSGKNAIADENEFKSITKQYTNWRQEVESLRNSQEEASSAQIDRLQQEGINIQRNIVEIQEKQKAETDAAKQSESSTKKKLNEIDTISKKLETAFSKSPTANNTDGTGTITNESKNIDEVTKRYEDWKQKVDELKRSKEEASSKALAELHEEGIEIQELIKLKSEEETAAKKQLQLAQQQASLKAQVEKYILSNGKAYKTYGSELDSILNQLSQKGTLSEEALKAIRTEFIGIQAAARSAGQTGNTFFETLKKGWEKFGGWSLITKSLTKVWKIVTDVVKAVKDVDAAMTELKKVTDLTEASYKKFLSTAQSMSQNVGATLADTVNATADFARLGYDIIDASSLAEAALIYKNVGDGIDDISDASESLISTVKAFEQFGESAENAMSIVDRFNEVGNNFAISSEGIGEALKRSASALATAGNDLNESIALITAANSVVQDTDSVGTALKTITMYLRAAKTEAEDAGESTDGMASSVSELRKELLTLTNNRVDIMVDDKNFKSTYDIMKGLSEVWKDIADIDQANIIELIGGKRNSNVITSLLTNFEDAESALQSAQNASGSAYAENEKYLDSINGKLSILKSNFESFSTNLVDSSTVKNVVDLGNGLLKALNILQEAKLLLPATTALIAGFEYKKLYSDAVALEKEAAVEVETLVSGLVTEKTVTDELRVSCQALTIAQQESVRTKLAEKLAANEITEERYKEILSLFALTNAKEADKVATDALNTSIKSIMMNNPLGLIMTLLSFLPMIIPLIEKAGEKLGIIQDDIDEINTKFNELSDNIRDVASEYNELSKSTASTIPDFVELSKGVDEFGQNVSLSSDDYERFLSLNNQIAEMFPEINLGMDSSGNAMLALSYSAMTLKESLESLLEVQRQEANVKIADDLPELLESAEDYKKSISNSIDSATETKKLLEDGTFSIELDTANGNNIAVSDALEKYKSLINTFEAHGIEFSEVIDDTFGKPTSRTMTISWDANSVMVGNLIQGYEREIDNYKVQIKSKWSSALSSLSAWLQTTPEYTVLSDEMQQALTKIVGNLDLSSTEFDNTRGNAEELENYILNNIVNPIKSAEPEVQDALTGLFDAKTSLSQGNSDIKSFLNVVDAAVEKLRTVGLSAAAALALKSALGVDDLNNQTAAVKEKIEGDVDDVEKYVDGLSGDELSVVYEILEANGSMSLKELKKAVADTKKEIESSPITILAKVESLSDGLDQLDKIYADVLDGEDFDFSSILNNDSFKETFESCGKAYEEFITTIAKSPSDINTCQSAFDKLAGTYIRNSDELKNVTDATRDATINILEQKGIADAAAIVDEQLALNKEKLRIETELGADATLADVLALYDEKTSSELTAQTLLSLAIAKMQANDKEIETADDVNRLLNLAKAAGVTAESLANLSNAAALISQAEALELQYANAITQPGALLGGGAQYLASLKDQASALRENAQKLLDKEIEYDLPFSPITYTGGTTTKSAKEKSNKDKDKDEEDEETWFDKQLKKHQHLVAMEQESEAEYLEWLKEAYKKAYKEGIIELDDYRKYKEEVFEKSRELFKDGLNDTEHKISLLEAGDGNEKEIVNLYNGLIKKVNSQIKKARKKGLTDNDDYIQELQDKLQDYANSVKEIQDDITDAAKDALDELADYRIEMLKQDIENEKDGLDKKLDLLKEFYDKQKDLLQKQYDDEQTMEERAEKQKAVSDVKAELSMLRKDDSAWAQKRKLELKEELSSAKKELSDFEKEDALNKALDTLEEAYNSQEVEIEKEIEALDAVLNNPQTLFNQALSDIKNNSKNQLYYQMLMYNRQYGSGNDSDIKSLWESAYGALQDYEKLFGKVYNNVTLSNATGVKTANANKTTQSSGSGTDTKKSSNTKTNKSNSKSTKTSSNKTSESSSKPSLKKGSTVQIKKSATNFGSKSNNAKMASFVPGGKYTVYSTSNGQVLIGKNGVYTGWVKKSDIVGYASGTKGATAGLHELYENGAEALFVSSDGSKYRILNDNDKVLNAKATEFLYDFANSGGEALMQKLKESLGNFTLGNITAPTISNDIRMGDVIVQGVADTKTVSEIRRAQRESVEFMLKEFKKLNK